MSLVRPALRLSALLLGLYLIALSGYFLMRPTVMTWGATAAEVQMALPGDEFIPPESVVSTRAITINAPAETVWAWVAGLGQERGGFYTYTFLENLFGTRMVNAEDHPLGEPVKVGARFSYYGDGPEKTYGIIDLVEPGKVLSIHGWTYFLQPIDARTTRLIIRYPFQPGQTLIGNIIYYTMFEQAHFIMESGVMLGLKQRAERSIAVSQN
jgi:hypothetical protein